VPIRIARRTYRDSDFHTRLMPGVFDSRVKATRAVRRIIRSKGGMWDGCTYALYIQERDCLITETTFVVPHGPLLYADEKEAA
jgi:hypothetical protein